MIYQTIFTFLCTRKKSALNHLYFLKAMLGEEIGWPYLDFDAG